jgi:hypothetical protein
MARKPDDLYDKPVDEVSRTVGTQSFSGASVASKAAPHTEYSSNKLGQQTTVYDGQTPTKYSAESDPVLQHLNPPTPQMGGAGFPKPHYPPCINPSCKSYGHSHPNCRCYAGPGGTSLEDATFAEGGEVSYCSGNKTHSPECEHYEHPQETLDGAVYHHGLLHALTKLGHSKSEDPMKAMHDHKENSIRGRKSHTSHMENIFEKGESHKSEPKSAMALKEHLEKMQLDPESLLEIGGNLDPAHSAQIAALAGTAISHLNSMKPTQVQNAPLDQKSPIDKMAENKFNRHLSLAENPASILQHVKEGTLTPPDIQTVATLYPRLFASMKSKANDSVIEALTKGKIIPYKQKQSLSMLLGQTLDSTQTPQAAQAIMASAGMQQAQNQAQKPPKKASGTELKQINKVDEMSATSLQRRQMSPK